jgi:pimeloyl-ACP methyl ester carboxylesterase
VITNAATGNPDVKALVYVWRTIPSYFLVARDDRLSPADVQRFMAQRAGSVRTVEVRASHVALISQPKAVADLIENAVRNCA